ncbi:MULTISPECIES: histidine phosphatase family protein [Actinoplanes]|uniref:histidine phosphatase family protein n=1 Tax=Actinoplanes TaxID=1865 RepID=UPI0005F2A3AF|nr:MULTISPECIES: histidine phosphatase family protein [Actinoplanes]
MTAVQGERLILVRHAMPAIDPGVPADRWSLAWDSRVAARLLRLHVSHPAYYVASTEPKAAQTMQEIAGAQRVATDAGLAEVHRPDVWFADEQEYHAAARAYAAGQSPDGWEPRDEVIARFDAAVLRHAEAAAAQGRTLVIGTHGLAPTVWMASRYQLDPDPASFWEGLRFPDIIEINLRTETVSCLVH